MRLFKLTTMAAALSAAIPAHAADTTLAEVLVQSDRDDFAARQDARSTKLVYGREELDRMNELTLGDYLRRLPGVTFTGPPGTPKDVRIRGMDKGYTEILIDGESIATGAKERQIQVDRLPLDMVERIELIRAPGADMSNEGMMGAINIVLRDAPNARIANARLVTGRIFGEKTDKDTWNLSSQYGNASGNVRWLLNASVGQRGELKTKSKSEQGFVAATGVRNSWKDEFEDERVTTNTLDFAPRLNIKLAGGDELVFTPWITRSDERKTKAVDKFKYNTPATGSGYVGDGRRTEDEDKLRETARLRGEWKHKLDGGQLAFYAAAQQGGEEKDKTALEYNAAGALTKTTLEKDDKDEREWYAGAKFERKLGQHRFSSGLEYKDKSRNDEKTKLENGVPKSAGRGDNFDIEERRWTVFLQDEIHLGRGHVLTPGVRAFRNEQSAVDGLGLSSGGTVNAFTPSMHYLWQIDPRNNLRTSVTKTLKPARFDDLSTVTETAGGVNSLSNPDKSGNPDLRPEKAMGLELGWEHFLPRAGGVLGANVFHRDIADLVEKRTELEGTRYVERPQNVGDAKVWGLELDARPRMDIIGMPELMLRFNYTRLYSEIDNTSTGQTTRIKDQPPYVYNIGFDWQLPHWNAAWGVNYNYSPKFLKNPTEPLKPDDEAEQKLLDLYVTKRLNRDLALRFTAANLLDMVKNKDKHEFNTSGQQTKFTQEAERGGRAFYVAIEGKW
ncbi:MAG: TonB-dependent receptor [Thiobacillus sp.]|nr:TonB-dependent receptor [Thiobacillus sp.]